MKADLIRLGHALDHRHAPEGGDEAPLPFVLALAVGKARLEPRVPTDAGPVSRAERILNMNPRPVYAYLGDLHPALGTVGLIFSRDWERRSLQGITRCDSGGLAGCLGGFACLGENEAEAALRSLSTPATCPVASWSSSFATELETSYPDGMEGYVQGRRPDTSGWNDERGRCIQYAQGLGGESDRRLWSWEARMHQPPHPEDLLVIVLSHEAFKRLESLRRKGHELPDSVRVIFGEAGKTETRRWFDLEVVRQALGGEP